jgi:hypothetical protein
VTLLRWLLLLLASQGALAGRPLVTDDARVLDRGHCQVEISYKEQRNYPGSEFWLLPACNPGIEVTLGGNRIDDERQPFLQAKIPLKALEANSYGLAASAGSSGGHGFVNTIASVSFLDDRAVVHANAGYLEAATWGVGLEALLWAPRVYAVAEAFGQRGEMPTFHYGIRFWVIPSRLQIDATRGDQSGNPATRFYSVGLRILF